MEKGLSVKKWTLDHVNSRFAKGQINAPLSRLNSRAFGFSVKFHPKTVKCENSEFTPEVTISYYIQGQAKGSDTFVG